jgi:hypothetical protein
VTAAVWRTLALFSSTDYLSIVLLYLVRQTLAVLREKVSFVGSPLALMDASGTETSLD